jgi:hypothetical protein
MRTMKKIFHVLRLISAKNFLWASCTLRQFGTDIGTEHCMAGAILPTWYFTSSFYIIVSSGYLLIS